MVFISRKRFEKEIEERVWETVRQMDRDREINDRFEHVHSRINSLETDLYSLREQLRGESRTPVNATAEATKDPGY